MKGLWHKEIRNVGMLGHGHRVKPRWLRRCCSTRVPLTIRPCGRRNYSY